MRRRSIRRVAALVALAGAVLVAACGNDATPAGRATPTFVPGSTMAAIRDRGYLMVGTKVDQPLFGLRNARSNEIEGFDVEVAKIVARAIFGEDINGKVRFEETTSRVREAAIAEGKVDIVVATYTINDARKQLVDFAGPYYIAGQDILVRRTDATIRGVQDLNDRNVCSVRGSTSLQNVERLAPRARLSVVFDQYSLCVEALRDGRVDAVTTDNVILFGFASDDPQSLKVVGTPFTEERYGIGLKKGDASFRAFLNDTLQASFRNGSWKRAWDATVGRTGQPVPSPPTIDRS